MSFRQIALLTVLVFVCYGAMSPATENPGGLPSVADLRGFTFQPAKSPNLDDVSNSLDIESVLNLFQLFHEGLLQVPDWKWKSQGARSAKDTQIYNLAKAAVVFIKADTGELSKNGMPLSAQGAGSILYPDSLILTAFHVVRDAMEGNSQKRQVLVYLKPATGTVLSNNLAYKATIEYWNESKDLAVLRFIDHPSFALSQLKLGTMSNLAVGQDIHVIGHPGGLYWTYTTGIVSQIRGAYKADINVGGTKDNPVLQSLNGDLLQIQTAINPGNSGGPVLDDSANIVGVVSWGMDDLENTNFAIAASEIDSLMDRRDKWAASQQKATPRREVKPSVSTAKAADGGQVIKLHYPNHDSYLIRGGDGKARGLVVDAEGTMIRAEKPTAEGGFAEWTAEFSDGSVAEGSGAKGLPTSFRVKK